MRRTGAAEDALRIGSNGSVAGSAAHWNPEENPMRLASLSASLVPALLAAAAGGCGENAARPADPPLDPLATDLALGEVRIHTNVSDPCLLTTRSFEGDVLEVFGEREPDGRIARATLTRVRHAAGAVSTFEFDGSGHLRRVKLSEEGGMQLDWASAEVAHVRFFDPDEAVLGEVWIDAATGFEVEPPPPTFGLDHGGSSHAVAATTEHGDVHALGVLDTLTVSTRFRDCDGGLSSQAAAWAESVTILMDIGTHVLSFPARREDAGFVADLPRLLTSFEWQQAHCEAALAWSEDVCHNLNEPSVGSALLSVCSLPAVTLNPALFYLCVATNLGISLYCAEARRAAELACAGLVTLYNPWEAIWGTDIPAERPIQAVAQVRTCEGLEERRSVVTTVTREDSSATLEIDGCIPDVEGTWTMSVAAEHVGFLLGAAGEGHFLFDVEEPELGLQEVGPIAPPLGPRVVTEECFWPHPDDPLDVVETDETAFAFGRAAHAGGEYRAELGIARRLIHIRPPTEEEIENGLPEGVQACLEQPESLESSFVALHQVYLKPFQKLVLRVELQGGAATPEGTTVASGALLWPPLPDGGLRSFEFTGNGTQELVITHDELRRAIEEYHEQIFEILPPDLPIPPNLDADQGLQCYATLLYVYFESELRVAESMNGATAPRATYGLAVLPD